MSLTVCVVICDVEIIQMCKYTFVVLTVYICVVVNQMGVRNFRAIF